MFRNKQNLKSDLSWYLIGTVLPMLFLFIRSPIYTRIFTTEQYGTYSIVYITFTYISALSYQGITNAAYRYYLKYKRSNRRNLFHTAISVLYLGLIVIIFLGCVIWYFYTKDLFLKKLIVIGFFFSFTNELFNTLFVSQRLDGYAKKFNLINSSRATLSFGLLLLLTFHFKLTIEAFLVAPLISNIVFLFPALLKAKKVTYGVSFTTTFMHAKRFIKYGAANLIYNLGLFLLITSDRYLIAYFDGYDKVGIYHQTYNIAQISLGALLAVFTAALNPSVLSILESKLNQSNVFLRKVIYFQLYLFIPITFLLSILSKDIIYLLLGEEFREAWNIFPIIVIAVFLSGLNYVANAKIKFMNNLKDLIYIAISAALLNIVLNIFLIPVYGYRIAAITTLISYIALFIGLYYLSSINMLKNKLICRYIISCLIICLVLLFGVIATKNVWMKLNTLVRIAVISLMYIGFYLLFTARISPLKKNSILFSND